jgi:hypothetical protein
LTLLGSQYGVFICITSGSEEEGEEEMSDGAASRMGVAGALGLSVTSSVSIVICNKYLISSLGFFFGEHLLSDFLTDPAPGK